MDPADVLGVRLLAILTSYDSVKYPGGHPIFGKYPDVTNSSFFEEGGLRVCVRVNDGS